LKTHFLPCTEDKHKKLQRVNLDKVSNLHPSVHEKKANPSTMSESVIKV
jgi:hypothetical protein